MKNLTQILAVLFLTVFTIENVNAQCGATSVTADPQPIMICENDATVITFTAAGTCAGNWQYRVNIGGTVVQAWSTTASFNAAPTTTTIYTVYARCSACTGTVVQVDFTVEVVEEPTISGSLVVCPNTSTTLTASGSTGDFEWTDAPFGNQLSPNGTYTTPALANDATYYIQATGSIVGSGGSILITECGLEGYAGAASADYLEISNLYANPVNTTGWVAAVSSSYSNINLVNTILWNMPSSFSACSVVSRNDVSGDPNYWGSNIMWNPGSNLTYRSWAIIIDDLGNVVDFVAWGWTAADIAGFNPTINGFNITLGAEWTGNGCDATCGVAGGPQLSIQRIGSNDSNNLGDFICQASTVDVVNPGLVCGWPSGVTCPYPVTVVVDAPPTASNPANINVQCTANIPAPNGNVVTDENDDYTAAPVVTYINDVSDNQTCPETITRTYRVTDDCGVFIDVVQLIIVNDTQAPVMNAPLAGVTVQCSGDVPAMTSLGYTDNCSAAGTVTGTDGAQVGTNCGGTITRTWTWTDACGNVSTPVTQIITINDNIAPVMAAPPVGVTVQCSGDVPAMTDLGYTDNCDASGTVTGSDGPLVGGNCGGTITRTWTWTDACGNVSTPVTQIITVNDNIVPVMATPPGGIAVQCSGDVPAMTDLAWTDNCDGAGTVTGTDGPLVGGNCGGTITRTWTYTDACGNMSIAATQIITVDDTTLPTASNPAPQVGVPPVFDPTQVTDEADNCGVPTVTDGGDISDGGNCPEIITRTYIVTDACGNSINVTQTFTIGDAIMPTASDPAAMNVECIGDVLTPDPTVVTDEADNGTPPVVTWEDDTSDNGSCPETILRRYRVTDNCGNFIFVTQTITVMDVTAPVMDAPPVALAVQCIGDFPAMIDLGYTDNCDPAGVVTGTDVSDGLSCPETITRTWTWTDACGNVSTPVTQTITVHDTQAPVMTAAPADLAVQCIGDVPTIADLGYTDNCDPSGNAVGVEVSDGLSCPETITRTWTFTDACGNIATETQVITVHDTQAPVMTAAPADLAVQCIGDVPLIADLAYTDNCDAPGNAVGVEVSDNGSCPETITRTWTYTDACGNIATETQTITVHDTQVPVFAAPPAAIAVQCVGDIPAMTDLGWTDNCDGANTVTGVDGALTDPCGGTITRTWTYTDACGNNATVTQTITVDDTTLPTASNPATTTVPGGPAPIVDINVVIDEADNCTVNPVVAFVSESSDLNPCPETITRIYSVTDDCGNTINVTHIILITDPFLPTASDPLPMNVECIGDVLAPDVNVVTDEADNQGVPVVAWVSDVSDNGSCPEIITRIYSVTDLCGGQILVEQTITVMDVTAPVMAAPPVAVAVQCIGDVPAMTDLGWTDNCDTPGTVTGTDVSDNGSCPETITRTWTYTDICGNVSTPVTQIITVQDTQAPVLTLPLSALIISCIADVPAMIDMNYTDNCDAPGSVTGVDVSDNGSCPETITRTWTYTDNCGNSTSVSRIITVHDLVPPMFATPPVAISVQCVGDVPAMTDLAWTDNCDGAGNVTGTDGALTDPCGGTITRTWTYTDACGNIATVTQTITVDDTTLPTASDPATTTAPGGPVPAVDINVVIDEADNCTVNPVVAFVSESSDNNPCPETITRIYSVTDDCGNTINVTHLILITDPIMPSGTAPGPINVECIGDVPAADPLLITDEADNQGAPVVAWEGDLSDNGSCPETITRTYSITDVCGNQITVDQIITVNDVTNPTATAPVTVNVECIGDVPVANILDITNEADNCTLNPVVVHVGDVSDNGSCPETITRTYSITDDCGNSITVDQLIIVNDVTNPTGTAPANVNVECIGDVPVADIMHVLNVADNCTVNPVVVHVGDQSDGLSCPETFTRTYSITDDCGNSITVDQLIVVNDVTNPTATNPVAISVPGSMDVPAPDPTVVTTEADNCTVNPVVAFVSDVSDGNVCNGEVITRTYSVTDDCGNTINITQEITILAVPAPIDAGPDQTLCEGELVTIVADNPWNVQIVWNPNVPNGSFDPIQTTTYTVTADNLGCISTDDITITVEPLPTINFSGDSLSGCEPLTVNFTNNSSAPSGLANCEWLINGQTISNCGNISYTFQNSGTYDVTLTTTSMTGCTNSDTYTDYIYVEEIPMASFTPSTNEVSNMSTEVSFTNNSVGATNYTWDFGDGSTSTQENPTNEFPSDEAGVYTVELIATSPLGCTNSAYATISVIEELIYWIPNSFTPDGDNYNEYFKPQFTSGHDPYDFNMFIYNRWGELIWESHDATIGWDGTFGAGQKIVQDGTYNWKIDFKTTANDERIMLTGSVTLIK